jgi:phage-related protein
VLIGEATVRIDALADDLKKSINRDINDALKGVKIDSDPLVKMTQDLRKAELELIQVEDAQRAAVGRVTAAEQELERLRKTEGTTAKEIDAAERTLTRARAEAAVATDKVTTANLNLARAHGSLTAQQRENENSNKSWIRSLLGSSSVLDSLTSKINIFGRRNRDAGNESSRTGKKIRDSGNDASGLGKVLDGVLGGVLKSVTGQFSAMGDVGSGVFSVLTSKAVLMPAALAPLLGVVGGLIIALPALAAVGGVALGAIALGMDGIKRAFKPLSDDIDALKAKVSSSFESALAPAVAKMPALFGAATTGLQAMATALGGLVTRLTSMLTTSENLAKIRDLFIQTAFFVKAMGPGIQQFTQGFLNLGSAVAPQLEKLGAAIGGIFGSIGQAFDRLSQLGLVTPAINGLIQVFGALGHLIGPILEIFGRLAATLQGPLATVINAIASGLQAAMPGIQAFADGIGRAFVALAPALQAILPLVGQVAGLIGGVLGTAISVLAPPLTKLIQGLSAGLAPVLPAIAQAFSDLGAALAPVLDQLAVALVDGVNQLLPLLPLLLGAITQMAPIFLQLVSAVIPLLPPLVQLVATILPPLIRLWLLVEKPMLEFAVVIINQVVPALLFLIGIVQSVVTGVVNFFTDFDTNVSKIWSNIVNFFKGIGDSIGSFFSGIGNKIVGWFQAGVDFLAGLPGKIGEWLSTLPGIVGNWLLQAGQAMLNAALQGVEWVIAEFIALPFQIIAAIAFLGQQLWQVLTDAWNFAIEAIKTGISNAITFFRELPGKAIDAVSSLLSSFSNWWHTTWDSAKTAVAQGVVNVIQFFRDLPSRAMAAVSNLLGQIRQFFVNAWNGARDAVSQGVSNVIQFFRELPGRALSALGDIGGFLYNAGRNIIQGFINGIKAAAGAIGDVVSGILSKVRRLLPFSPAKEGPFSGRGWTLYSGMALVQGIADGLRAGTGELLREAATMAAGLQAALTLTPTIDVPNLQTPGAGTVPDLSRGPQSTAEAQLAALTKVADTLLRNGQRLPEDLAAAIEKLSVVVSAEEESSKIKQVDQTNGRRR